MKSVWTTGLIAFAIGMAGSTAATPASRPLYPPFGLDLTAIDTSVKPGDDFFQYANGRYLARTPIPADQSTVTRRSDMTDRIEAHLHTIFNDVSKDPPALPTDIRGKVGAFYAAFMDEAAIAKTGLHAIDPELSAIRAAPDRAALANLMGRSTSDFYPSPFYILIDSDLKQPDRYAVYLSQSGLGLPGIGYYVKPEFAPQRAAYRNYAAKLLALEEWPDPAAAASAVLAFEMRIAQASWTEVQQRDPTTQYNPVTPAQLDALAPGFAWHEYLAGARIGEKQSFVLTQNTAFPKIAALVAGTPVSTLKAWMAFRVADDAAPYLPRAFSDARFEFRDHVLEGQAEQEPRWKRGIAAVAGADCSYAPHSCFGTLQWAVGQLYVERYFPPATKSIISAMAKQLQAAFRRRLERLDWMGPITKAEALRKLDTYVIKVGYPDRWRDYSHVRISRSDLTGDVRAAAAADWAFQVARSAGPVDRGDWLLTPQANNAYNGSLRDIVFPAGILQAPIFDAAADPAINYGAAGAVIGHELTHGFDDEGRAIDAKGALRDWWTQADAAAFKARAAALGAQFAQYEPVPGIHINPDLTMGENLADLGGVLIALDAYHASLKGKPAPVLHDLTGDQRFFLGWAQAWAGKATAEEIRRLTTTDEHSFRKYRVNGVLRNIAAWYVAFGVKPGDALYIAPEKRAHIW
ncbi:M13 family metallopeptidase [Rhodanobacter glycinis]|uniref:M13 family metallopeptidase n=1 Tax=Rhodanobacter glycinis TaxID=582702 RepID=A0A5B9E321_9GAMM|nr:M13 family metallopeptidase [Rhodanobacter glycinis]QEE24940.1 M13 family metallopeptidase [Rhodanobacter glycinis]